MKKIMALLCTVAMSVGLLAGCGSSSGDNQSVSGSDNTGDGGKVVMLACEPEVPAEKEAWEEVAADFEKETGIQVELRFQEHGVIFRRHFSRASWQVTRLTSSVLALVPSVQRWVQQAA